MKKTLPIIYSLFLLTMVFCILNSSREVVGAKKVLAEDNLPEAPPCPHFLVEDGDDLDTEPDHVPTTPFGSECRLHRDVIGLVEPLKLESGIKLNCQGHKITPAVEGILGDANSRSVPELGIFLDGSDAVNGVQNVLIQNCTIEGFDHGILAVNSKVPEGLSNDPAALEASANEISGNTINARFVPIHLVTADNFKIKKNIATWRTRGGVGIFIQHDSDHVDITENTITGDFLAQTQGAVLFPGLTAIGPTGPITPTEMNSNPVFTRRNAAILAVQVLGPHPQLFNAIIGDSLYQFTTTQSPIPNEDFTGDTLVEGNIITYKKNNSTEDGIVVSNTLRTTIRNNTIGRSPLDPDGPDGGRQASMRSGGITGPPGTGFLRQFPGNCTLNSTRHCLSDFDCNIPGIDPVSQDTCDLPQTQSVFWIPSNIMIENNTIYGPFGVAGISSLADDLTIQGNNITGPLTGPNALGGINIFGKFTIEKAVITRNRVSGVSTALFLNKVFGDTASFFGAKISLNDFTGYTTAVGTSNDYDLPSELSVDGKGNYWGLTCAEGGFDPTKVLRVNGTQNPNVVDSHPYGEPVANTPEEDLPLTCF